MADVPYRTGIPSILKLLTKICALLVAFRPVVGLFLTPPQLSAWDGLLEACNLFSEVVTNPRPDNLEPTAG